MAKDWEYVARGWQKWHTTFESGAHVMSRQLIDMAKVGKDASVLDIATGIGDPAIDAAKLVGPGGYVLATDISAQMLSIARERSFKDHVYPRIDFIEGDASIIELPESEFNSALCRLGLMFIPELDITMYNIYRSLVDGGRFAASVWSTADKVPQLSLAIEAIRKEIGILPTLQAKTDGPFSLADEQTLKETFLKSGFKEIIIKKVIVTFEFASGEEYADFTQDIAAPVIALLRGQSSSRIDSIWRAVARDAMKYYRNDTKSVILDNEAICIVGIK